MTFKTRREAIRAEKYQFRSSRFEMHINLNKEEESCSLRDSKQVDLQSHWVFYSVVYANKLKLEFIKKLDLEQSDDPNFLAAKI